MTRMEIVHTTTFTYPEPVAVSINEARMRPVSTGAQTVVEEDLSITPVTWSNDYRDYWGTRVTAFEVRQAHTTLNLVSHAVVDVRGSGADTLDTHTWDDVHRPEVRDRYYEFLADTEYTCVTPELAQEAKKLAGDASPGAAVRAVFQGIFEQMEYVTGVTGVHTSAAEAWAEGKGVCQDMAHIAIAMLRSLGIPARYVSGYLHPNPGADIGQPVAGQSHAWVQWYGGGWNSFDPTNNSAVGQFHVEVAHGRDYADVAPVRGVVAGGRGGHLDVTVQITRTE